MDLVQTYALLLRQPASSTLQHYQRDSANGTPRPPKVSTDEADNLERLAWAECQKLLTSTQKLALHWHDVNSVPGWQTWRQAAVPHLLRLILQKELEGLFTDYRSQHRLAAHRATAE